MTVRSAGDTPANNPAGLPGLALEDESLHEWHDHAPLEWDDEGVAGCPSCERHWECPPSDTPVAAASRPAPGSGPQ